LFAAGRTKHLLSLSLLGRACLSKRGGSDAA
jgi:hypothetical protein